MPSVFRVFGGAVLPARGGDGGEGSAVPRARGHPGGRWQVERVCGAREVLEYTRRFRES